MKRRRSAQKRRTRRRWLIFLLILLVLLFWPRRVSLEGLISPEAVLMDADSGEVLAAKNADASIYPASMTKVMTVLLVLEANPDLDTPVTLPGEIFPALQTEKASVAGFLPGETATVRDLLYGALLPSGAECCETLAREVSGSEEAFVASMNRKAAALGMASTHFCNPTGLHDPEHVSTARDMAVRNSPLHRAAHESAPERLYDGEHVLERTGRHGAAPGKISGRQNGLYQRRRALPCQRGGSEREDLSHGHGGGAGEPQHRTLPHRRHRECLPSTGPVKGHAQNH